MEEMEIFRRLVTAGFARRTSLSERALGDPDGPADCLTSDPSSVVRLLGPRRASGPRRFQIPDIGVFRQLDANRGNSPGCFWAGYTRFRGPDFWMGSPHVGKGSSGALL